jgi:hypothetical protein
LILRASGTGKSTLAKQMQVHLLGHLPYSRPLRSLYEEIIRENVTEIVQTVLHAILWIMKYSDKALVIPGKPGKTMSGDTIQEILEHIDNSSNELWLQEEVRHDIRLLWNLPEVREAARQPEVRVYPWREGAFDSAT